MLLLGPYYCMEEKKHFWVLKTFSSSMSNHGLHHKDMIDAEEFCDLFDVNRNPGMWQTQYSMNGPWIPGKRSLDSIDIREHLNGRMWLSTKPRGVTESNIGTGASSRWLVVDIDDHGEKSDRYGPVASRVATILRLFDNSTPIIFSSPTGNGKHIYFKYDKEISIKRSLHPIVNLCIQKNIMIAKYGIAFRPYPTTFLRLPLGKKQKLERFGNTIYHDPFSGVEAFLEIKNKLSEIVPLKPKELMVDV